jgi:hypothetical protein
VDYAQRLGFGNVGLEQSERIRDLVDFDLVAPLAQSGCLGKLEMDPHYRYAFISSSFRETLSKSGTATARSGAARFL